MSGKGKLLCLIALVCLLAFLAAGCAEKTTAPGDDTDGTPAKVFEWKFQSHWPAASASFAPTKKFLEETVYELTNGRVKIELHPADTFMPTKDLFDAWSANTLQGGTASPSYWVDFVPLAAVASNCPLAFREYWEAAYFHEIMGFEKALKDEHLKYGILYWSERWYPTAASTKFPVRTLDDLKGLKIRSSGAIMDMLKEVGAAPVTISGGEIYTALSTGVVDAVHWGAALGMHSMSFHEINKYYMQPNLAMAATDVIYISKKAWDELPRDLQTILDLALQARSHWRSAEYEMQERAVLRKMIDDHGVQVVWLNEEAQAALMKAAVKVWDEKVASKSPENAYWVEQMKGLLRTLGYLD